MKRKILSIALALVLVLAGMPAVAFADADQDAVSVSTFQALKQAIEAGASEIEVTGNFNLEETLYVTSDVKIYSKSAVTLTRTTTADVFVLGQNAQGKDAVGDLGGDTVDFVMGGASGSICLDGAELESAGSMFLVLNSSTLELGSGIEVKNCHKTSNSTIAKASGISKPDEAGGAAVLVSSGVLNINGASLKDNKVAEVEDAASSLGGAIYNFGTTNICAGTISGSKAYTGGAIYNYRTVRIYDGTIEGNTAIAYGGAIAHADSQYAQTLICGQEKAAVLFKGNSAQTGGAVYTSKSSSNEYALSAFIVNQEANAEFKENTATNKGGAIYGYAYTKLDGVKFTSNSASKGAAAYFMAGNTIYISDCTFTSNSASSNGGAIYSDGATLRIIGTTFASNSASTNAGAIHVDANSDLVVYNSTFNSNTAGNNGGALYFYSGNAKNIVQGCSFDKNTATSGGGVMYSSATGTGVTLFDNIMTQNGAASGGAIYTTTTGVTTNIKNLTIGGNTASSKGSFLYANTNKVVLNIDKTSVQDGDNGNAEPNWASVTAVKSGTLTINACNLTIPSIDEEDPFGEVEEAVGELKASEAVSALFDLADNTQVGLDDEYSIDVLGGKLTNTSNFQSIATKKYDVNGIGEVTLDTLAYEPGTAANNVNVAEGILIYEAMLYKKAHPSEKVSIDFSTYRFSPEAAVNINRNSDYFGYMRNLAGTEEYDQYGFVRISYLLVSAAKMGINVNIVAQRGAEGDVVELKDYFKGHLADECDSTYVTAGTKLAEYLNFTLNKWDYTNKASTELMHTKMCVVSNYIDVDGVEHGPSIWLSGSNLDKIQSNGKNGYDAMQTAVVISDNAGLCKTATKYFDLVAKYSGANEVYDFRNEVNKLSQELVYQDEVFTLYFAPVAGENATWNETSNYTNAEIRNLYESDSYIWFGLNNPKFDDSAINTTMQKMIAAAFNKNKNSKNRLCVNIFEESSFNEAAYAGLTVGSDIGLKSIIELGEQARHNKDMFLSYSKNGQRSYVTIMSSMNTHEGAISYQSNFSLIIKETNIGSGSVFRTLTENTTAGLLEKDKDIDICDATIAEIADVEYTGKAVKPKAVVSLNGKTLVENQDYELSYENNISVGEYAVLIVTGIGNYQGEMAKQFSIVPIKMSKVTIDNVLAYTGKAQTIKVYLSGKKLSTSEYSVAYYSDSKAKKAVKATNVKNVGTYYAKISAKGDNYSGSVIKSFTILPKALAIKSLKGAKKALTVSWKKSTEQTTGYQIKYSLSKKMTSAKIVKANAKASSVKIGKLKAKKKYYVQIRRYTKLGTKIYYSDWSAIKSVKSK